MLAATLAFAPISAMATTITFDDLTPVYQGELISNGYQGFQWENFGAVRSADLLGSGYDYGTISGPNVGLNWSSQDASFSRATPFSLQSFYMTRAWFSGTTRVKGYNGLTLLYSVDIYGDTTTPIFASFNWNNLTKVVIADRSFSSQTAIDNITVNSIPEPRTYALLLVGLGLVGVIASRNRKAA